MLDIHVCMHVCMYIGMLCTLRTCMWALLTCWRVRIDNQKPGHSYIHIYIHIHTHTHTHTHTHIHIYIYIHILRRYDSKMNSECGMYDSDTTLFTYALTYNIYIYIYIYIHIYIYTYIYTDVCMYAGSLSKNCIYIHVHIYTYVCMYACIQKLLYIVLKCPNHCVHGPRWFPQKYVYFDSKMFIQLSENGSCP
jgi:hypothetical protein